MRVLLSLLLLSIAAIVSAQVSCNTDPAGSLCPMSTNTREASSSLSPRQCNEPTVQCFADPCSIRPEVRDLWFVYAHTRVGFIDVLARFLRGLLLRRLYCELVRCK